MKRVDLLKEPPKGESLPHDSAAEHVRGLAAYIDDLPRREAELAVTFVGAPCPCGRLDRLDLDAVRVAPGVVAVFTADDLPGHNVWGPILVDEPFLADDEIGYLGQPIAVVAAETRAAAEAARSLAKVEVVEEKPILHLDEADERGDYLGFERFIRRGDVEKGLGAAAHRLDGEFWCNGQEQFYLESQAALAEPRERGEVTVYSSTQNPTEIQKVVAEALGLGQHQVICITQRMGGAFGGKETQAAIPAVMAALVAQHTGRPARVVYGKDDDMQVTGKRHETRVRYRLGFDEQGRIEAADFEVRSNGGAYADLSTAVLERTMLHLDNAYYLPHVQIGARVCRTNLPPNTAFRGFGGPQAMAAVEHAMEEIAVALELDPLDVRRANLYGDEADATGCEEQRNVTPYGQTIEDDFVPEMMERLEQSSEYRARRDEIAVFNEGSKTHLRGLSMVPVKFGISFTNKTLNQGNALVNVYTDGTVQVSTGATEMGQGVNVKIAQIVAEEFGIDPRHVIVMPTSTEKNNNTSPTAASASTDINGTAAVRACGKIRGRLASFAAEQLGGEGTSSTDVRFEGGRVFLEGESASGVEFAELTRRAHVERIDLGARGFYATPGVDFDRETGRGTPFFYYTTGWCVAEVLIDRLIGELSVERLDVLMDIGQPIHWEIERGQVIGGLVQGLGWVTTEELVYGDDGRLLSDSPTTYKIPNVSDLPERLTVEFVNNRANWKNLRSTKAVGEPPLMLAVSVFTAVKDALRAVAPGEQVPLRLPATHEEIVRVIEQLETAKVGVGS
ncbi:MAG: xanthine dehydrogenase molybdopterin binding subunit [Acidobacteriota bacterium]